jgi:hypothetical protein
MVRLHALSIADRLTATEPAMVVPAQGDRKAYRCSGIELNVVQNAYHHPDEDLLCTEWMRRREDRHRQRCHGLCRRVHSRRSHAGVAYAAGGAVGAIHQGK